MWARFIILLIHIYNACLVFLVAVHKFTPLGHVHIHAFDGVTRLRHKSEYKRDGVVCSLLHKCTFSKHITTF